MQDVLVSGKNNSERCQKMLKDAAGLAREVVDVILENVKVFLAGHSK